MVITWHPELANGVNPLTAEFPGLLQRHRFAGIGIEVGVCLGRMVVHLRSGRACAKGPHSLQPCPPDPHHAHLGLPRFRGQVDRSHAMTLRLSIDDQPNQDQAPVHASAEAGGY